MDDDGHKSLVQLHIYDLSKGMARSLSPALLGMTVDGIWHTAIVAYGREVFFGGSGIYDSHPGSTHYGQPDHVYDIGYTHIPREIFVEYLEELRPMYTGAMYDIFDNNCNNFTDELSMFLTGKQIPSHITGLPKEILATPFGGMIRQMIQGLQDRMAPPSSPSTLVAHPHPPSP